MENAMHPHALTGLTDQEFYHELTIAPPNWLTLRDPDEKARKQVVG